MSHKPYSTKCWIKFLALHGYSYNRTAGSHFQYTKPGFRTIPVWEAEKEIPAHHIKTGLRTLGVEVTAFENWVKDNC